MKFYCLQQRDKNISASLVKDILLNVRYFSVVFFTELTWPFHGSARVAYFSNISEGETFPVANHPRIPTREPCIWKAIIINTSLGIFPRALARIRRKAAIS